MKSKFLLPLSCLALAALAFQLQADSLRLRDGRVVNGTFLGASRNSVEFDSNTGGRQRYDVNQIESISFGNYYGNQGGYRNNQGNYERGDADRYGNQRERPYNDANRDNYRTSGYVLPAGTIITVRMIDSINSDATRVGESYRASLDQPIVVNGRTIAPAGSDATVQVVRVQQGGRISGREEVTLGLASFTANGRIYDINTASEDVRSGSRGKQSAEVIGGGAALGAIIGAIAGGGKGAAIGAASGAAIGTGAQVLRGQTVKVPSESRLSFTLTQDLTL